MHAFTSNWLTEGWLDEEYKQFILLAWLKQLQSQFDAVKLYPAMEELTQQQRDLKALISYYQKVTSNLPTELSGLDFGAKKLIRQQLEVPSEFTSYLERMTAFALPKIQQQLAEGAEITDFVSQHLVLEPVGILPLYKNEGYVLLQTAQTKAISLYRFSLSMIELVENRIHRLQLQLLERKQKSTFQTAEQVKLELIRTFNELPNPAVFVFHSKMAFPENETLIPICKSMLVTELCA